MCPAGQCWFSGDEVECTSVGVIKHCIGQALLKVKCVAAVGFWRMSSAMREERSLLQLTDSGVSYKQTSLRRSHSTLLCLFGTFPSIGKDASVSYSSLCKKKHFHALLCVFNRLWAFDFHQFGDTSDYREHIFTIFSLNRLLICCFLIVS